VNGASTTARRLRWTLLLPAVALAVTIALSYLDHFWSRRDGLWDYLPVTTAQGLAALLTGPSPLVVAKLPARLMGVAVSWAWLGFLLDRRLSGLREPIIRNEWLRPSLYFLGLILALSFAWEGSRLLHTSRAELDFLWRVLMSPSARRALLGRELTTAAQFLWGVGFAVYFSAKLSRGVSEKAGRC
jgi:hypothetical protein